MEHFADFKKNVVHLYAMTWKELQDLFVIKFKKQTTEIVYLSTQKHYIYRTCIYTIKSYLHGNSKQTQASPARKCR